MKRFNIYNQALNELWLDELVEDYEDMLVERVQMKKRKECIWEISMKIRLIRRRITKLITNK